MSIKSFIEDRRDAFIQRWHARPTRQKETIAEHHYFVTRNSYMLALALQHYGIAKPDLLYVFRLAMVHDIPERYTGDVSGEAKRKHPKLKKVLQELEAEAIMGVLFEDLPRQIAQDYIRAALDATQDQAEDRIEVQIVGYADKLEALLFSETEVVQGNTLMADVVTVVHGELDVMQWDWLIALRRETGLP